MKTQYCKMQLNRLAHVVLYFLNGMTGRDITVKAQDVRVKLEFATSITLEYSDFGVSFPNQPDEECERESFC